MKKVCPYIALKWQLKENINFHEHTNNLVFKMASNFFLCFMFVGFAFKEEEEGK
jgi:hypothetical protein